MAARYATRKPPLLAECPVAPESCDPVLPRLTTLMAPFVATCCRPERDQHAHTSMGGLLSDVGRQNIDALILEFYQVRQPLAAVTH